MFDNIRADFRAHGRDWGAQGFWALSVYRFGRWRYGIGNRWLRKPFSLVYKVLFKFVQICTGIELPCEVAIGRNFVIDHHGGIIVSGYARFGDNCRIRCGVVVGLAHVEQPCAPWFGDDVDIGAGAKVLGPIKVGSGVRIGANAVVVADLPDNCTAVGVPAVWRPRKPAPVVSSQTVPRERWPLLNVWIDDFSTAELLERLQRQGGTVFTFNPDHAYHLHHNRRFLDAYRQADVITMDSNYLFAAMRLRGIPIRQPVRGSDLVEEFLRRAAGDASTRVFLLGARPGVAAQAAARINQEAGRQLVIGAHGPSMQFVQDAAETDRVIDMVNASGADVLLVGLGAPKQETWIAEHRHRMAAVKVFLAVGAVIDYQAGVVQRAPPWCRALALEWAYRVVTEPRRYLLRYASNLRVFWWMLLEHRGSYRNPMLRIEDRS